MANFEKEVDRNLALFEVLDMNGAPVPVGGVVEFGGYAVDIVCVQTETALRSAYTWRVGSCWYYAKEHIKPLTKLAREIHAGL
jgi:hypothetical protein